MRLEESSNATLANPNRSAGPHRMPEIDRFIVISPVLELDVRFSDRP
jgi:hypothetical protein